MSLHIVWLPNSLKYKKKKKKKVLSSCFLSWFASIWALVQNRGKVAKLKGGITPISQEMLTKMKEELKL